ncbi:hypothetical protein HID58_090390 [Brassica napus]|uniref:Uncharacterized protein n=1 Tax=Brassica napus TaxID=3708 RepID=A0ABQ7X053_BRANA|nr:hypothetical protein HID58_090390 [Brassica napus]
MALSAAFKERLDQMEFTRNQRLHLLQVPNNPSISYDPYHHRSVTINCIIEFSMFATDFNNLPSAEKELQVEKSQILATKHANIQSIERKCLMLDQKIAAQNLKITLLRSTIQDLDSKYHCSVQQLRTLKSEVEELKELDQEREKYYELKCSEMNEFMQNVERFRSEKRLQVKNLRDHVKELSSTFEEIHNKNNYLRNTN